MASHCYKKSAPINKFIEMSKSPLFFHQCRERSLVSCLLSPVFCLLSPISCLLSPVSLFSFFCLLPPVSLLLSLCFPSSVSCLSSLVSRLAVSCLLSTVSRLLSHFSNAVSAAYLAELAILWSKLADLGNLAILMLVAGIADWKQIIFCRHGV